MNEDARQSLTALVTVSLFFGACYFVLQLLASVELPRWVPAAGFALNAAALAWQFAARRGRPRSAPTGERRRSEPPKE